MDMVRPRGQLGILRLEKPHQIPSFLENLVHVTVAACVPAVLGTEAADLSIRKGFVKLVFQRCRPE